MFEEIVPEYSLNEQEVLDIKASKAPKKQYCPYFEECGGCIWGYSENAEQLDQAMQRYIAHVLQQETYWNMDFLSPDHAVQQAIHQGNDA